MASTTAAQDEFNQLVSNNTARADTHPEDKHDHDQSDHDLSEEDTFRNSQIDAAMRTPTASSELKLPPASFDSGRFTGVKGVIADARSFETARKTKWIDRARSARRSILGFAGVTPATGNSVTITGGARSDSETDDDAKSNDEDSFLSEWRESRRRELESAANRAVRTRKTSPSVRIYGRLDEVDAMGYLDAIEKVSRDTTVVVFVYDNEVSSQPRHPRLQYIHGPITNMQCNYSARYPRQLNKLSCLWYASTRLRALSRSTTTTLSLTRPPYLRYWHTATKVIWWPTSRVLSR